MAEPNLLGLPPEMRLQIYRHVILEDTSHCIDLKLLARCRRKNSRYRLPPLVLSRQALVQTCKLITCEMRGMMEPKIKDVELRTYQLEIHSSSENIEQIRWKRLPCSPSQVERLAISFHISGAREGVRIGLERSFLKNVVVLLNLFLHAGPKMNEKKPLREPIKLTDIVVDVNEESAQSFGDALAWYFVFVAGIQWLNGSVEYIRFRGNLARVRDDIKIVSGPPIVGPGRHIEPFYNHLERKWGPSQGRRLCHGRGDHSSRTS